MSVGFYWVMIACYFIESLKLFDSNLHSNIKSADVGYEHVEEYVCSNKNDIHDASRLG